MAAADHKQTNVAVRYRYVPSEYADPLVDPHGVFPVRDTWEAAAGDAVEAGGAEWINKNELRVISGKIERVRDAPAA